MTDDGCFPGKWTLTINRSGTYVAYRPPGWKGKDPHEQITAPTREELVRKLRQRERRESGLAVPHPRTAAP